MAGLITRKDDHGVKTTQTAGTEEWEWWKRWGRPWTRRRRRVHLDLAISPSLPPPLCSQLERGGSIWTVAMSHSPPSPPSHCRIECGRSVWTWPHHPARPPCSGLVGLFVCFFCVFIFPCIYLYSKSGSAMSVNMSCHMTWHGDWPVGAHESHALTGRWVTNQHVRYTKHEMVCWCLVPSTQPRPPPPISKA